MGITRQPISHSPNPPPTPTLELSCSAPRLDPTHLELDEEGKEEERDGGRQGSSSRQPELTEPISVLPVFCFPSDG